MNHNQLFSLLAGLGGFLLILAMLDFRYLVKLQRSKKRTPTPVPSPFRERAPRVELVPAIKLESLEIVSEEDHDRGTEGRIGERTIQQWLAQDYASPTAIHVRATAHRSP